MVLALKTDWNYSKLAASYVDRADYSIHAIQKILNKVSDNPVVCDIGAGVGHLTKLLSSYALKVDAVEPNNNMRQLGIKLLGNFKNIEWYEGIAESTGLKSNSYDLVSFGSSFNVCNQKLALQESHRLLKGGAYFTCMWNLRDLSNPLQHEIENIIKSYIPNYSYGIRRQDQTQVLNESKLFVDIENFQEKTIHKISSDKFINAWRSHATLERQAKNMFDKIVDEIAELVINQNSNILEVPYETVVYLARKI